MYSGKRSDDLEVNTAHSRLVLAFIIMQLIGAGGLVLILLTALISERVKRHSIWYSFTVSWIFSCICYCLLFFAGQQVGDPPDATLCKIQAALIYAAPALTACTTLSLVIQTLLDFRAFLYTSKFDSRPITKLMLLGMPYLVWGVVFVGVLVFVLQHPRIIRRSPTGMYCSSSLPNLSRISSSIVMMATVVLVLLLAVFGYRFIWVRHRMLKERAAFATLLRVVISSVIGVVVLGLSLIFVVTKDHGGVFDMFLASMPLLAMLFVGSQSDLIRTWTCQRDGYTRANGSLDQEERRHLRPSNPDTVL